MNLYVVTVSLGLEEGRGIFGIYSSLDAARDAKKRADDKSADVLLVPFNTDADDLWCTWPNLGDN